MGKLEGRVALVTGSGRGIGREVALQLANEGAKIVVNDLDEQPAYSVVEEIERQGGQAIACPGSVTEEGFSEKIVGAAIDAYGDLHIIVNNAGYTWDSTIQKMSETQFDAMIDVHLKAPWKILKAAHSVIRTSTTREREAGSRIMRKVVNVSSISGLRGTAGQTNYASAKAGLLGLTKTLSKEWGRYNVCVNAVAFGVIETRLTEVTDDKKSIQIDGKSIPVGIPKALAANAGAFIPLGRAGTAAEAAGGVLLMCLPESDYVSGQVLEVSGGY